MSLLEIMAIICLIIIVTITCFIICSIILDYVSRREDAKIAKEDSVATLIANAHKDK